MRRHLRLVWLMGALWLAPTAHAQGIEFSVRHSHALKSCQGELVFKEQTVEYSTPHKKHARVWSYRELQQIGLLGPKKIAVLTYEDQKLRLGKDRTFEFDVIRGEVGPSLAAFLEGRVGRPLVSAFAPATDAPLFQMFVKHRRGLGGGKQGRLEFSEKYISYLTDAPSDSRVWRYGDISSVGTTGPYQLRLTSLERVGGEFGEERNFVFDLKDRLDPKAYNFIWWKINGPQIRPSQTTQSR